MSGASLRGSVDGFVRSHPVLRAVAGAVVDRLVAGAKVPPPGLKAGRGADPVIADRWPAVLVVCLDASADTVAATVRDLQLLAGLTGGVRPVLVLDQPHFALPRRAGLAVEHVVSRHAWELRHPAGTWADYLHGELAGLRHAYSVRESAVVLLPRDGTASMDLEALGVLLTPHRQGPLRRTWSGGVRRVARGLDAPVA